MTTRRSFLKGTFLGIAGTLGIGAGARGIKGDFNYLAKPIEAMIKPLPEKHDELKVILLGTGAPLGNIHRAKPANAILAGEKVFLVDCGGGEVVMRLLEAGIPPQRVGDIFFTHHHSDHNNGFTEVFSNGWLFGLQPSRSVPLRVYGPTNTKEIIGKFRDALDWDVHIRRDLKEKLPADGAKIDYLEMNDGVIYDEEGIKVTVFTVDHGVVQPSVGYKFEYNGKVVVISGDTLPTESVVEHSQNADILIHDSYSSEWMARAIKKYPEREELFKGVMSYHSSAIEAAEIAEKAKAKHLVLTHVTPPPSPTSYFERNWAKGISDAYSGKATIRRDLMVF